MKAIYTFILSTVFCFNTMAGLLDQARYYQDLYGNPGSTTSISKSGMNQGETRPKAVLKGVFYFGGSDVKRKALSNQYQNLLCENGFSKVYSVYTKVSSDISCGGATMQYRHIGQANEQQSPGDKVYQLLAELYDIIKSDGAAGPIYLHCFYGVHASNTIGQMVQKQFCGISDDQAENNWDKVDLYDSLGKNTPVEIAKVRNFRPYPEFQISAEEQAKICY